MGKSAWNLLLISLVPSSPAIPADAAAPSYQPGERFVLDMADERSGNCAAEPQEGFRFTFRCDSGQARTEDLRPYFHLPLRIGKSWTHRFREVVGGTFMILEATVTGRETVTVPAGTYQTYRVEIEQRRDGAEEGSEKTCWYAPVIQFPVKCEGTIGISFMLLQHYQ